MKTNEAERIRMNTPPQALMPVSQPITTPKITHVATSTKKFSWSYSKLKNYETCPRRYQAIDVDKTIEQGRTAELDRGDDLHEAMQSAYKDRQPFRHSLSTWKDGPKNSLEFYIRSRLFSAR